MIQKITKNNWNFWTVNLIMRAKKLLTSRQIFRYAVPARTVTKKHCILALGMASPGNQHCDNCIGTLSFPMSGEQMPGLAGDGKARPPADFGTQNGRRSTRARGQPRWYATSARSNGVYTGFDVARTRFVRQHGRPHIGANGVSWPLEKWMKN